MLKPSENGELKHTKVMYVLKVTIEGKFLEHVKDENHPKRFGTC